MEKKGGFSSVGYPAIFILLVCAIGAVSADTIVINAIYDAYAMEGTDANWATIRADAGDSTDATSIYVYAGYTQSTTTSDVYTYHRRAIVTWNTSVIPAGSSIDSAIVSLDGAGQVNGLGSLDASIIDTSVANPRSVVAGDYDATTFTRMADDIAYASYSTGWNNWTLNAAGLAKINITGDTSFMFTHSADTDNSALAWASAATSGYQYSNETSSTPPRLIITYTAGTPTPTPTPTTTTAGSGTTDDMLAPGILLGVMAGLIIMTTRKKP